MEDILLEGGLESRFKALRLMNSEQYEIKYLECEQGRATIVNYVPNYGKEEYVLKITGKIDTVRVPADITNIQLIKECKVGQIIFRHSSIDKVIGIETSVYSSIKQVMCANNIVVIYNWYEKTMKNTTFFVERDKDYRYIDADSGSNLTILSSMMLVSGDKTIITNKNIDTIIYSGDDTYHLRGSLAKNVTSGEEIDVSKIALEVLKNNNLTYNKPDKLMYYDYNK